MKKINILFLVVVVVLAMGSSCNKNDAQPNGSNCIKGKFIGFYCDGVVIKILDDSKIGKDWKGFNSNNYENSVLASIDTNLIKSVNGIVSFISKDSVLYFKYKDGGYARKQFNNCLPASFITIISVSSNPCSIDNK